MIPSFNNYYNKLNVWKKIFFPKEQNEEMFLLLRYFNFGQ